MILVGYNDDPHVYADGIDKVLHAMHKRGVKQVLWLTLRPVYITDQYRSHELRDSRRVAQVLVDDGRQLGRLLAAAHQSWFDSDGIHFTGCRRGAVRDLRPPHAAELRPHRAEEAERRLRRVPRLRRRTSPSFRPTKFNGRGR